MPSIDVNGTSFHYNENGHGPALVLLHGFPLDCRIWDNQVRDLGDRYRVITPDLRGFGQTTSDDPFSVKSLADDVHAFARKLGIVPFVLGGLSMGGYISFAYIKCYPSDLRGLALIDTRPEADSTDARANRMKMIDSCRQGGSKAVSDLMMPKMLADSSHKIRPQVVEQARRIMEACPPRTIEHALLALRDRDDYCSELPSICVPTLLVYGQSDAITPPSVGEAMMKHVPHARLVVVPDAGHLSPMENPGPVTAALRGLMKEAYGAT